jgi:signal transduction histidine kinase
MSLKKKKNKFWKTLTFRFVLWYCVLFSFTALLLYIATDFFLSRTIWRNVNEVIAVKYGEYETLYEKKGSSVFLLNPFHYFIRLANSKNQTLFLSEPSLWKNFPLETLNVIPVIKKRQWIEIPSNDKDDLLKILAGRLSNGKILEVGRNTDNWEDLLEAFQGIFAGMALLGIGLGIAGGFFFSSQVLKPIRNLIQTAETISTTGKIEARIPLPETQDELWELIRLFNEMLEKIERVMSGMKEALDNVAHDLRTPMTRMRAGAELALQKNDPKHLQEALSDCMEESEKVLTMLKTLMDISETESGTLKLQLQPTNLSELARDVLELYEPVAAEKNITLNGNFPETLIASVDANRIRQVLANLIDNAIKYTNPGGSVVLKVSSENDKAVFQVKDSGIGIPPEEIPRIWERLYRGDKSRSERGLGLGLSLVKAIVEAHHGSVEVSSTPNEGSTFTVNLSKM